MARRRELRRSAAADSTAEARVALGRRAEEAAARALEQKGFQILDRGWRCALGELDLVARADGALVFIEVRSRSSRRRGSPEESISRAKQRRLCRLALAYARARHLSLQRCRFDVVAVRYASTGRPEIRHLVNAFDAWGLVE